MATSSLTKYHAFIDEVSKGGHNFQGSPVLKLALTNTAPTAGSDTVWSLGTYPAPVAANGYPSGGLTITITSATTTSSVFKLVLADTSPPFTATAGGIGPFRYAILYNTTASNKLIGYYDYGVSGLTLASGETLTVDFDGTNGALTIT